MESTDLQNPLTTLIVGGQLVHVSNVRLNELFDDLIGQQLTENQPWRSRSFLCEDHTSKLNNLFSITSSSPVDFTDLSDLSGLPGSLT